MYDTAEIVGGCLVVVRNRFCSGPHACNNGNVELYGFSGKRTEIISANKKTDWFLGRPLREKKRLYGILPVSEEGDMYGYVFINSKCNYKIKELFVGLGSIYRDEAGVLTVLGETAEGKRDRKIGEINDDGLFIPLRKH